VIPLLAVPGIAAILTPGGLSDRGVGAVAGGLLAVVILASVYLIFESRRDLALLECCYPAETASTQVRPAATSPGLGEIPPATPPRSCLAAAILRTQITNPGHRSSRTNSRYAACPCAGAQAEVGQVRV
jgi:hypothetical protein